MFLDHPQGPRAIRVDTAWTKFSGHWPHGTCDFEGERYAAVHYSVLPYADKPASLSETSKSLLQKLGFKLPDYIHTNEWPCRKPPPRCHPQ